ncbi:MAG: glucose-1-phosphate thymidylyltransferase [Chitinophagaceae bacterium]|nr:glucose-1-phosphate thymidylyltransferase [Chitinophagaceae bacterium]
MQIVLIDNDQRNQLFPLNEIRANANITSGILTNKERWEYVSGTEVTIITPAYLQDLYPIHLDEDILCVDASYIFNEFQIKKILELSLGNAFVFNKKIIAGRMLTHSTIHYSFFQSYPFTTLLEWQNDLIHIDYPWKIFQHNDTLIRNDYNLITADRISNSINKTNTVINPQHIFIEDGADIQYSSLNATAGPIYIGRNVTIMEGCYLRGPLSIGENSLVKMGAKIYGATSIGSNCVISGEIKNTVIFDYSNKAHDGYLGDSVIGSWCNLGAGTSNSNLKNNAGVIEILHPSSITKKTVGQKCGVIMGDYTKTAINSSINTGSIFGVCCNIFGAGLLPKYLPNFSWGVVEKYQLEKAFEDIEAWKIFKQETLTTEEKNILTYLAKNNN